jgi:RNA polymerase sigma factor (sigma-70 family)
MPPTPFRDIVPRLRRLLAPRADGDSDAALVARFAGTRDEAAFAQLVARHGPLVRGVCRRVLGPDAADDAFQATFLVLARKAGSIKRPAAVGSWLYGVAYHLSKQAQRRHARRERYERGVTVAHEDLRDPSSAAALSDLLAVLDAELARLPDRLRAPLLLCYIEGRTQDEASKRLGWSLGTFRRRLDRAREVLRVRMERRGATLSAGLFATLLATDSVTATVPAALIQTTTTMAMTFLAGGAVAPSSLTLAREGIQMLGFPKLTAATVLVALVGGLTLGAGALFGPGDEKKQDPQAKADDRNPDQPPPPAGVVARLGTSRFRHGAAIAHILVTPDGQTILTQSDRSMRFWDRATGADRGAIDLTDDGPNFWTSSLTPDGKTLLTTRRNGSAQVWDLAERKMQRSFRLADPPFDTNALARASHAPDGSAIAVVMQDGSIRVCDVASGRERQALRSHSDAIRAVAFTADSNTLILARDQALLMWDAKTGKETAQWAFARGVQNLSVAPNSTRVAGFCMTDNRTGEAPRGGPDGQPIPATFQLVVRAFARGEDLHRLGGHASAASVLSFTPDGQFLLAPDRTSDNRILLQWDLATNRAVRQYLPLAGGISALTFTPNGDTLITADQALHFWNWKTGNPIDRPPEPPSIDSCAFVLMANGKIASLADGGAAIVVRELATGREVRRLTVADGRQTKLPMFSALAVSGDARTLAAVGIIPSESGSLENAESALWVWDLANGKLRYRLPASQLYAHLAVNHDGTLLAATSVRQPVAFWDLKTGRRWQLPGNEEPPPATLITFPPGGTTFAAFSSQRDTIAWNLATGEASPANKLTFGGRRIGAGGGKGKGRDNPPRGGGFGGFDRYQEALSGEQAWRFALTPDFRIMAESSRQDAGPGSEILVLDLQGGQNVRTIGVLQYPVKCVALSADGRRVAAAGANENPTITAWDVATGRQLKRFTGLRGHATGLEFTPDGKRLVAASSDGTLLVWDVPD